MKTLAYSLLIISLMACSRKEITKPVKGQTEIAVINANSNKVDIKDDGNWLRGVWTLAPDAKPDIYKTKVEGKGKYVSFHTDLDSVSFWVEHNKTYDFIIVHKGKDTCWHQINTMPNFKFSQAYINKNKGTYSFEIPEVQELVHILFAITPTGKENRNLVLHDTEYYKKVIEHFDKYKNENIVQTFETLLQQGFYTVLKMDACGFYFDDMEIKKDSTYVYLNWSGPNNIEPYLLELQDFAQKSDFRTFYAENKAYYQHLMTLLEMQSPIKKQWEWVEKQFNTSYDNYRITFSPLVNGAHSTNCYVQDDFKQSVMFVRGPIEENSMSATIKEGLMTRLVFTEIDHNYVNPTSDKYLAQIEEDLSPLTDWASESAIQNYGSSIAVFNEYLTWSVFSAYAFDNYEPEFFEKINERVEIQMTDWRGFKRFTEFNQYFLKVYKNKKPGETIEDLYPDLVDWFKQE